MAAGKFKLYDTAKEKIGQGIIDLDSHTFKLAKFLSTSNANTLTLDELADLTNEHANANGYTTGGKTLNSVTWTRSGSTCTFDAADSVETAAGGSITARFDVIYDDSVVGKPLVAVSLLDTTPADVTATDGNTFTTQFNASGIFTLSGATTD